jgi:hypothetical protein
VTGWDLNGGAGDPTGLGLPAEDLDHLADYVGGALAGTPAEREVAGLIERDPAWQAAYDALAEASVAVSTDLASLGRTPEPVPADVAERITAALATATRARTAPETDTAPESDTTPESDTAEPVGTEGAPDPTPAGTGPVTRRTLSVVPGEGGSRRRWRRWAGPVAAAAAVLAFCGFGLRVLPEFAADHTDTLSGSDGGGSRNQDAPAGAPAAESAKDALARLPIRQLTASGTDYGRNDVGTAARALAADAATGRESGKPQRSFSSDPGVSEFNVAPPLRRLTAPAALSDCLAAIGAEHPRPATAIELVDYAAFEGAPALTVVFTDATGERRVWVAGPDCGLPGAGADTRYQANVG